MTESYNNTLLMCFFVCLIDQQRKFLSKKKPNLIKFLIITEEYV